MAAPESDTCAFAYLVYQLLVVEKRLPVKAAAAALGMSADVLRSRLAQRTRFRPAEVQRLVALIDDPRLLRMLAEGSTWVVTRRPDPAASTPRSIRLAVTAATREAIDVMEVVIASLERGTVLGDRDRAAILKEVQDAETAMAAVRLSLGRTGPDALASAP